jgi:PAS domain S-box-containing protein
MPLYNNLFNLIPLPAWIYHEDSLHILDVNECAIVQYGYSKEAFLGLNFKDLQPKEEIPLLVTAHAQFIKEEGSIPYGTFTHIKKNGESIRIKINAQKVVFEGQNSVLIVSEEIKKEENQLNLAEARLISATSIAKLGYWRREIATGKFSWTDEIYKIWGRNKNDFEANYDAFMASIHPIDLERYKKAQQRSLDFDEALDIDHRILLPNGNIKWVHEQGRVVKDKEGNAIYFEGTVQDISSKKIEEETDEFLKIGKNFRFSKKNLENSLIFIFLN